MNSLIRFLLMLWWAAIIPGLCGQTLTELAVPAYFGCKSSASSNNSRTPFAVCLQIDGLQPSSFYDVKGGIGLVTDPPTTYGAGNVWDGTAFSSFRADSVFLTDTAGSSGPFWIFFQPTGNAARFDAGQVHNLRIGYTLTGGTFTGAPSFIGTKTLTALDIASNQRTPDATDDGAFIRGSAMPQASGKYVLLYDNVTGSGDPLSAYQVRQAGPVQTTGQSDLPVQIREIYLQGGSSTTGDYPAIVPTGSNNPSGVRRIEARNSDFSLFAADTDDDGIWPSGANTTAIVRREVLNITAGDAPLTPCEPLPPVSGFSASDTAISVGDTIRFFDSTLHCPETWKWSFVGGIPMSSTLPNPEGIVFNYPGEYNICLITANAYGTHTHCKAGYIKVTEPFIPDIVITEIMYNPPESGTDSLEYIELYNNDSVPVNLQDYVFSEGITYTFPSCLLQPGGFVVVCRNDSAFQNTFGSEGLKWTSGSLTNGGELILLKDPDGHTVDSVEYDDTAPWDPLCNGGGYSLELCDPGSDNAQAANWRHALGLAAVNAEGDSIWARPGNSCLYLPVAVFAASDSMVAAGDSVIFTSLCTGFPTTFEWEFEGGEPDAYTGEVPPPVVYPFAGNWDVLLKVTNPAGQDILLMPDFIGVSFPVSVDEPKDGFTVYPNPAVNGSFTIRFPEAGRYAMTLQSVTGNVVWTGEVSGTRTTGLNLDLPPALYLLTVCSRDKEVCRVKKIIIQ